MLLRRLAAVGREVFAVLECNTAFLGRVQDNIHSSLTMQEYFAHVIRAEQQVFGNLSFLPGNVRSLSLRMGDLSLIDVRVLGEAFASDIFVVFGSSYIRGDLCDRLVERRALNIHMGVSPYYRGSSCNFWAMYDKRPELVGATIHLLGRGLDSGPMLFHALPAAERVHPFVFGMKAVDAAQKALCAKIASGEIFDAPAVPQESSKEIRYTRNADFTDMVAREYLDRLPSPEQMFEAVSVRPNELYRFPVCE